MVGQRGTKSANVTLIPPTVTSGPPGSWITAQKVMARPEIKPRSPAYMADALTAELLTTPAEMSTETMTDGSALNC